MSPENAVYNVIAFLIRAYTGFDTEIIRSPTSYVVRIKNVPTYGEKRAWDVDFVLPAGRIAASRMMIKIKTPINSREVRIVSKGKSFRHPHIFDDGHPCWNGSVNIPQSVKPEGFCYANSWLPIAVGGEANM